MLGSEVRTRKFPIQNRSVTHILCAAGASTIASAAYYFAYQNEPATSGFCGVSVRILCNILFLFTVGPSIKDIVFRNSFKEKPVLHFWALFGVLTVFSYFYAIPLVGAGLANFSNAGSNILIVVLSVVLLKHKVTRQNIFSLVGCAFGMLLLTVQAFGERISLAGFALAAASGVFAGLAYLMVVWSGESHHPKKIVWAWFWPNFLVVLTLLGFLDLRWPTQGLTWFALFIAGAGTAAAQYFTILAYQRGRSALVASLSYLGPAMSFAVDAAVFRLHFTALHVVGFALIVIFGGIWPLSTSGRDVISGSSSN